MSLSCGDPLSWAAWCFSSKYGHMVAGVAGRTKAHLMQYLCRAVRTPLDNFPTAGLWIVAIRKFSHVTSPDVLGTTLRGHGFTSSEPSHTTFGEFGGRFGPVMASIPAPAVELRAKLRHHLQHHLGNRGRARTSSSSLRWRSRC